MTPFAAHRDRWLALALLATAMGGLLGLRPLSARSNNAHLLHLLHRLIASRRLRSFPIQGADGPFCLQTATSNGHIVTISWTAVVSRGPDGIWVKTQAFDYQRTYQLVDQRGVSTDPDVAVLERTTSATRATTLAALGFRRYPP